VIEPVAVEVVTLGECLVSLVPEAPGPLAAADRLRRFVAGAEANVAVGLARLGHRAAFIGRVGSDGFGEAIRRQLRGEGVDVSALSTDPSAPTGVMVRELRSVGPADVVYLRRGSAGSRLSGDDVRAAASRFDGARWLHLTGITPALSSTAAEAVEAALVAAREHRLTVSLDVNLRRKLWSEGDARAALRALASRVDIVFADLDEARVITGLPAAADSEQVAAGLRELGPAAALVKLGADGALLSADDGPTLRSPAFPVAAVVDPVGAGDAFCAGFIGARLDGLDDATALAWANACGASVVASLGDQAGLPTGNELERLLASSASSGASPDTIR
jgi:2-dehydro-3-deoxygluconokinase